MRPAFEKNHFLVMYAILCKYNKNRLPGKLVVDIRERCDKVRKELRQTHAKETFGKGTSKLSAKRRAQKFKICVKYGKHLHQGACSKNQTSSNYEYVTLCKDGPLRCFKEKSLNPKGNAYISMRYEILRLQEKAQRLGYQL